MADSIQLLFTAAKTKGSEWERVSDVWLLGGTEHARAQWGWATNRWILPATVDPSLEIRVASFKLISKLPRAPFQFLFSSSFPLPFSPVYSDRSWRGFQEENCYSHEKRNGEDCKHHDNNGRLINRLEIEGKSSTIFSYTMICLGWKRKRHWEQLIK